MSTWEEAVAMATLSEGNRDTVGRQGEQEGGRTEETEKVSTENRNVNQFKKKKKKKLAATENVSRPTINN